jgi:LEA14-like dessication related protein
MPQTNNKYLTVKPTFILLVAILTLGSVRCNNPVQKPVFVKIKDAKLGGFSLTNANAKMTATLVFTNPNAFGVQAKDAKLKLFVEGNYVGDIAQASTIDVAAKSNFDLPLIANFDLRKSLGSMVGLLGKKDLKYKIDGTIRVGKADIFVNVPVLVEDVWPMNL